MESVNNMNLDIKILTMVVTLSLLQNKICYDNISHNNISNDNINLTMMT
jgi:hypothetical protein